MSYIFDYILDETRFTKEVMTYDVYSKVNL